MSNVADTQTSPSNAGTAKKLIHAAALAAALVPLGSVLAHGATISCFTTAGSGAGCDGTGTYTPTGSGGSDIVSNTWKFFNGSDLIYTFEIKGVPTSTFSLDVSDFVTTQGGLEEAGALVNFPNATCIPTFDAGVCGVFDVFVESGEATWDQDGYYATITWFSNVDPLSAPPNDGNNHILQAKNASGGTIYTNQLIDTLYDPNPSPTDPALGGRGDSFSQFGAFRTTPEPSTLLLLGTGIVTAMYRRRKRRLE
jgi:hypothetical protein